MVDEKDREVVPGLAEGAEQLDVASAEGSAEVTHEEDDRRAWPEGLAEVVRSPEVIALDGQVKGRVVDVGRAHDA